MRRLLLAAHVALLHRDDRRIRAVIEVDARDDVLHRIVAVVVHADALAAQVCEAGAAGRAAVFGYAAVERMVSYNFV